MFTVLCRHFRPDFISLSLYSIFELCFDTNAGIPSRLCVMTSVSTYSTQSESDFNTLCKYVQILRIFILIIVKWLYFTACLQFLLIWLFWQNQLMSWFTSVFSLYKTSWMRGIGKCVKVGLLTSFDIGLMNLAVAHRQSSRGNSALSSYAISAQYPFPGKLALSERNSFQKDSRNCLSHSNRCCNDKGYDNFIITVIGDAMFRGPVMH